MDPEDLAKRFYASMFENDTKLIAAAHRAKADNNYRLYTLLTAYRRFRLALTATPGPTVYIEGQGAEEYYAAWNTLMGAIEGYLTDYLNT